MDHQRKFYLNSIKISADAEFVVTLSSSVGEYIEMPGLILNGNIDSGLQSANDDELMNSRSGLGVYCLDVAFLKIMMVVRKYSFKGLGKISYACGSAFAFTVLS